jgi:hypothetical protein
MSRDGSRRPAPDGEPERNGGAIVGAVQVRPEGFICAARKLPPGHVAPRRSKVMNGHRPRRLRPTGGQPEWVRLGRPMVIESLGLDGVRRGIVDELLGQLVPSRWGWTG